MFEIEIYDIGVAATASITMSCVACRESDPDIARSTHTAISRYDCLCRALNGRGDGFASAGYVAAVRREGIIGQGLASEWRDSVAVDTVWSAAGEATQWACGSERASRRNVVR